MEMEETASATATLSLPSRPSPSSSLSSLQIDNIIPPSELLFSPDSEIEDELKVKQMQMELAIERKDYTVQLWRNYAKTNGGLNLAYLNSLAIDSIRKVIWPLLVGVTEEEMTEAPSLESLSDHPEYNQVILDVNRSLKRFPPGIPYEQRVALQDQLTVLILRVIIKYPHLKYYQGYHDVAITLLLVCGDRASFPLLCRLSHGLEAPLAPFMQVTMAPTQHRLNYLFPLIDTQMHSLADFLQKSTVETIFALPWYLTWFGHSLNRYSSVVRLYDYFLCAPPMFPVYVTTIIVIHRSPQIFDLDCDMATVHCFLSQLPDDLPFEEILVKAAELYAKHPPEDMEKEVLLYEQSKEEQQKREDEERRRKQINRRNIPKPPGIWYSKIQRVNRYLNEIPLFALVPVRYRAILATATLLAGVYAVYKCDSSLLHYIR